MPKPKNQTISLFIGGIQPNVQFQELSEAVHSITKVKSLKIIRDSKTGFCKGYAFATVRNRRKAKLLLESPIKLRDRFLICQERGASNSKQSRDARRIFVGGLSTDFDDSSLLKYFEQQVGPVNSAYVIRDFYSKKSKGYGYIEFDTEADAISAISAISRGTFSLGDRCVLQVQRYLGKHMGKEGLYTSDQANIRLSGNYQQEDSLEKRDRKETKATHDIDQHLINDSRRSIINQIIDFNSDGPRRQIISKILKRSSKLDERAKNYWMKQSKYTTSRWAKEGDSFYY